MFLAGYKWANQKYNFDNLGHALMSLFVLSSKGFIKFKFTHTINL
jgi:hypothetical protein